jgi:hypothetical protein
MKVSSRSNLMTVIPCGGKFSILFGLLKREVTRRGCRAHVLLQGEPCVRMVDLCLKTRGKAVDQWPPVIKLSSCRLLDQHQSRLS